MTGLDVLKKFMQISSGASVSVGISAMIQVNRVARVGRQLPYGAGKIACCTVAQVLELQGVSSDLMAA